jgi:surface polysaccharide O-acyltransferase-like enzyme
MSAKAPREAGIELGRIFCCYCVILIHLNAFYSAFPQVSMVWSIAKCASTPVFFLIAGYFFNADKPFSMYMSRLTARVLIPTLLVMLIIAQFTPWLSSLGTFADCFKGLNFKNFGMVFQILITQWPYEYVPGYNPFISLWFTFALLLCYLCIPLLKIICAENPTSRKLKIYLMYLGGVFFVFRVSLLCFFPNSFAVQHLDWWIEQKPFYWLWLMIIGHELNRVFRDRAFLDKWRRKLCVTSLAMYILGGVALYSLTMAFNVDPTDGLVNQRYYAREFVIYFLAQMGMFVFFLSLNPRHGLLSRAILYVADKTFYIYILHESVYHKVLWLTGLDTDVLVDYLVASFYTFLIALIFAIIFKNIERSLSGFISRKFMNPGPKGSPLGNVAKTEA